MLPSFCKDHESNQAAGFDPKTKPYRVKALYYYAKVLNSHVGRHTQIFDILMATTPDRQSRQPSPGFEPRTWTTASTHPCALSVWPWDPKPKRCVVKRLSNSKQRTRVCMHVCARKRTTNTHNDASCAKVLDNSTSAPIYHTLCSGKLQ